MLVDLLAPGDFPSRARLARGQLVEPINGPEQSGGKDRGRRYKSRHRVETYFVQTFLGNQNLWTLQDWQSISSMTQCL